MTSLRRLLYFALAAADYHNTAAPAVFQDFFKEITVAAAVK
jgi:hypothetical protein